MFDRIAGVYDLLNTAMTAGLHHRWRARAADLARVGPGDRACSTWRRAPATSRSSSPGASRRAARWSAATSPRGCSRARARRPTSRHGTGVRPRFEWGDALALPYADDAFDAATVGFGARNFADLAPRAGRDGARRAPGRPRRRARDHDARRGRRCRSSTRCGSTASCRCSDAPRRRLGARSRRCAVARGPRASARAGGVTIADAYTYLPSSVKRFPAPAQLAAELERAGLGEIAYVLLAGGIVAIHAGTVVGERRAMSASAARRRGEHGRRDRGGRRDHAPSAARACASAWSASELHLERVTAQAGAPLAVARERDRPRGRQAPAPAAGRARGRVGRRPAGRRPTARSACCARPWRSSWCTRRRSSTTT